MKRRLWIGGTVAVAAVAAVFVTLTVLHHSPAATSPKADSNGVPTEDVAWVKDQIAKGALVLDVRKDDEWAAGRVPQSMHIPLAQVQDRTAELPKGRTIITVCKDGGRSYKAAYALRQAGFNAVNLAGGLTAWTAAGLPVVDDTGAAGRIL